MGVFGDGLAPDVGGHDDYGVLEVYGSSLPVRKVPVVEQLQHYVEHVRMGFLDLIKEHHRIRTASDLLGQLPSFVVANISYGYWNHYIATELNPAIEGSQLLGSLSTINTVNAWAAPFDFVGMVFLPTGIGLALATIIRVLRWQSHRLWDILT